MTSKVKQKWSQHKPFGKEMAIDEEGFKFRFIAFKVPMEFPWNLRKMVEKFPDLNLVIDLCATDKYYRLENLKTLKPTAKFKKIRGIGNPQSIPADATIQE